MNEYRIIHREELIGHFFVEANSEEEALAKWNKQVCKGEIDFSDLVMVSSSEDVELEVEDCGSSSS